MQPKGRGDKEKEKMSRNRKHMNLLQTLHHKKNLKFAYMSIQSTQHLVFAVSVSNKIGVINLTP
jgi:hypothetical protein